MPSRGDHGVAERGREVFTQRFEESDEVKVLVLHGGPACTHEYMLNVAYQMPDHPTLSDLGAEVHMYDQLGGFYSDQPKDSNIDRWVKKWKSASWAWIRQLLLAWKQLGRHPPWSMLWFTKKTSKS